MEKELSSRVRTVQWEVSMVSDPVVIQRTVDDRDNLGCTALHWAALNDRSELMRWLMGQVCDSTPYPFSQTLLASTVVGMAVPHHLDCMTQAIASASSRAGRLSRYLDI